MLVLDGVLACRGDAEIPPDAARSSQVIDLRTGDVIHDFGLEVIGSAVFNPEGAFPQDRYLAVVLSEKRVVEIYDPATWALVTTPTLEAVPTRLGFDPTGRYLIGGYDSGAFDGRALVLDLVQVVDGRPIEEALVFDRAVGTGSVPTVALNADGILATTIARSLLRLWDIHTDQLVAELTTAWHAPHAAFSPEGDYLYYLDSSLGSFVLRRFPLDTNELIALAESRLTRGLTPDECQRYAPVCPIGE
jgi:WD40 repeat protein